MDDEHFDVVTNMTGFLGKNNFYHKCKKSYSKTDVHNCPFKFSACKGYDIGCDETELVHCELYNMDFYGPKCFDEHLRERPGTKLPVCNKICNAMGHECKRKKCKNCKNSVDLTKHKCYIQKCEAKGGKCTRKGRCEFSKSKCLCCRTPTTNYIWYDFETVEVTVQYNTREFVVNYVSAEDFNGKKYRFTNINEFCASTSSYRSTTGTHSLLTMPRYWTHISYLHGSSKIALSQTAYTAVQTFCV